MSNQRREQLIRNALIRVGLRRCADVSQTLERRGVAVTGVRVEGGQPVIWCKPHPFLDRIDSERFEFGFDERGVWEHYNALISGVSVCWEVRL